MTTCEICRQRPATGECTGNPRTHRHPARGAVAEICRICHAHKRMAYACECLSLQEALEIHAEWEKGQESMAAKKTKTPANGNGGAGRDEELPAGVPKGAVARERYEEKLPCKSDDSVIAVKARELARLEHQRTAFRESWKAQCAKARERRAFFEERIEELAAEVDGQVEMRNVEVLEYLLPTNEVIAVRLDTSEIISSRTAEAEDLQESIPGAEEGSKKKRKGKPAAEADATAE